VARSQLQAFLLAHVADYGDQRDLPAKPGTSQLSAHLAIGTISAKQCVFAAQDAAQAEHQRAEGVDKWVSEMAWRDFYRHIVAQFDHVNFGCAFRRETDALPWRDAPDELRAWQQGQTGYPLVDAAMRQLNDSGWMHNRLRMVSAMFLTKHLLIHWREGARWFWDTLVDADLANNSCGWQWVAGSGADASPYFRIFNPITQGKKFDAEGAYIRRWVPELAELPDKYLNCPWEAPQAVLEQAGVTLGGTYPVAIVDHKAARESALAAYGTIRS